MNVIPFPQHRIVRLFPARPELYELLRLLSQPIPKPDPERRAG
jgi:hypothetical protein